MCRPIGCWGRGISPGAIPGAVLGDEAMTWKPSFLICAALVLALAGSFFGAMAADLPTITEIRGSKLVLYASPKGKQSERIDVKSLAKPIRILVTGAEQNGRYPVKIGDKTGWVGKAQAKKTNFVQTDVTAKCQSATKSYTSSRGFGQCD